ncbi:MAG: hypothetical protein K940chlam2_01033 [Chlamydiae bacterium]|nr:hypothetical protein [Chlamydiota bacterium]
MTVLLLSMLMAIAPGSNDAEKASKAQMKEKEMQQAASLSHEKKPSANSVMMINPKDRAEDYQKAFQVLRDEKSTSKVYFQLANGKKVSNVIEMKIMPGNTLILFRYTTPQGIKYDVAGVEDIMGIAHL